MECTELAVGLGPSWRETLALGSQEWMPAQPRGSFHHGQLDPAASAPWAPSDGEEEKPKTGG